VPIEYMACNTEIFEPADHVVIEFANFSWDQPKVIGFKANPRPCPFERWNGPNGNSVNEWTVTMNPDLLYADDATAVFSSGYVSAGNTSAQLFGGALFINSNYHTRIILTLTAIPGITNMEGKRLRCKVISAWSSNNANCYVTLKTTTEQYQAIIASGDGTSGYTADIYDCEVGTNHAAGQNIEYRFAMGSVPVLSIRCDADGSGGQLSESLVVSNLIAFDNTALHVSYSPDYQSSDYTAVSLTELNTLRGAVYSCQTALAAMLDSLSLG